MAVKTSERKNVLITRQFEQSGGFVNALSRKGYFSYLLPMIETVQLCPKIDAGTYEVILFTSANAVKYFTPYNDRIHGLAYVALGPKTAQAMEVFLGVSADRIPIVYDMENVKKVLSSMSLNGARILSPGAVVRTDKLESSLNDFGAEILTPPVYETNFAQYPKEFVDRFLKDNSIKVITFCSPSAVKSFFSQFNSDSSQFEFVSIGKTTHDYLENIHIRSRYPETFTVEALVDII